MEVPINLQELFGGIDIYLFDQLLKGRITPGMRILDAGCGSGRNLVYFLRSGYEVFAVDESREAIAQTRRLAAALAPHLPMENFRVEPVERMSWGADGRWPTVDRPSTALNPLATPSGSEATVNGQPSTVARLARFDLVLSSAVLHFARDEEHWQAMVNEMWRVLSPGGIFFARLASTIGMENRVRVIQGRRYHLPDGSDRFLVDEAMLRQVTTRLGGELVEPVKTTVVENLRAMTTWVAEKK